MSSGKQTLTLEDWIDYTFDRDVSGPAWAWEIDREQLVLAPAHELALLTETFERSGELLARFSDNQLGQGFSYLVNNSHSTHMFCVLDESLPIADRCLWIASFHTVFEQVMAARCVPALGHLDEAPASSLNGICYMWWDEFPMFGQPDNSAHRELDAAAIRVMERILAIPHDACRECALHGLGHWRDAYPHIDEIITRFQKANPNLRRELWQYSESARIRYVQ